MSLRLIRPGLSAAGKYHPRTALPVEPIGFLNGQPVWPVIGGDESDDPNDSRFTGGDNEDDEEEDDEEEDEEEEEEEEEKPKGKKKKDEDEVESRPERQAARYRVERNKLREEVAKLQNELRKIADKDKPADELMKRDLDETRERADRLVEENQILIAQLAFFKANTIDWVDPNDAFALAEREGIFDELVDEDGMVDERKLAKSLRDLAKRKPHLVKKVRDPQDDDDEDEDEGQRPPRRTASKLNGKRKGKRNSASREELSKRFPVLGR